MKMINAICPITNTVWPLPYPITSSCGIREIEKPHPLLAFTIPELNTVGLPASTSLYQLYVLAYLHQLGKDYDLVTIRRSLPKNTITPNWIYNNLSTLQKVATWIYANGKNELIKSMPCLSIDKHLELGVLSTWLEEAEKVKNEYEFFPTMEERAVAILQRNLSRGFTPAELAIGKQASSYRIAKAKSRLEYLEASFNTLEKGKRESIIKMIFRPQYFEVSTLQEIKNICLGFLLEDTQDNWETKQKILRELDQHIIDRIGIDKLLDEKAPKPEIAQIESDILQQYIIRIDDENHVNAMIDRKYAHKVSARVHKLEDRPVVPVPTKKPERADYKNELQYRIALDKYSKAGGQ